MTGSVALGVEARAWDDPSLDLPTPTADEIRSLTNAAIDRANARIDAACAAAEAARTRGAAPAFEDLFGALDDAAREVAIAYGRAGAQALLAEDDEVREAATEANDQIEVWRAGVAMREGVADAIERYVAATDLEALDDLDRRYVERWQRDVRLAGSSLPAADRSEVEALTSRLQELTSTFMANLAKTPHITASGAELEGSPDVVRSAATPVEGEPDRFDVPVNPGVYGAIVERSPNRDLRERAYRAWCSKGVPENLPLLRETFEARRRLAHLLGFPSWQAYRTENLAAPDTAFINGFIDRLVADLRPIAEREMTALGDVLRSEPGAGPDFVLEDWDWRYAQSIQRDALGADPERLSQYFELHRVLDGLAELTADVFGIRLEARPERIGWDPAVRAYDLIDVATDRLLAHVFVDLWARNGKQAGAWTDFLLPGGGRHGEHRVPTLSLVLNASQPADGPALLSPYEVQTLFHEFGHVLNFACGGSMRFVVHRQTWIPFDIVEGPSEFGGRWSLQAEVVARFARHHATREAIPTDLVEAVGRSEALNASVESLRLLAQVRFDALVHGETPISIEDAQEIAWSDRGVPWVEGTFYPAGITHFMGGGYDAALYGYVWAMVIRDDLLERFAAGGLLSPEMGATYRRTILEVTFLDDPLAAINAFLGRPWSIDAFIRRASAPAG